MGRYFTKRMIFLLLTPILLLLLISSSSGEPVNSNKKGVSIAQEGRFPPSESEGKLPKLADLEFKDLNLCKVFHGKTCCSSSRILSASVAVKSLAAYGEVVKDCLDLFEGIQSGTIRICASFCDGVFEACSDACFSGDQVIVPCGGSESIMCGKAFKWEANGTAFCYAVGLTEPCYGSKLSLEQPVVKEPLVKTDNSAWFLWLQALQIFRLLIVTRLGTLLLERLLYQQQMRAMNQRLREER